MRKQIFFLSIFLFFSLIPFVSAHTITVPSNAYFGIPALGTFVNFDSTESFDSTYREGNYWYFDEYALSVENANMSVSSFFEGDRFEATLTGSSESTSTTSVYAPSEGEPSSVEGADGWDWDPSGYTTITVNHASPREITIVYELGSLSVLDGGGEIDDEGDPLLYDVPTRWGLFFLALGIVVVSIIVADKYG